MEPRTLTRLDSLAIKSFESRQQYHACHVTLPDSPQRVAAIRVNNAYYSFFKTAPTQAQIFNVAIKLQDRGERVVITKTPKGFALWVLELDAQPIAPPQRAARQSIDLQAVVLDSHHQYQPCQVRVPDLDQRLAAIAFKNSYYSLFKTVDGRDEALRIKIKLDRQGDEVVITKAVNGYSVWILEPDAYLD